MSKELTETQKKILLYIVEHINAKGYPPTLSDIALNFNYRNRATVQQHLKALEKKNYITRTRNLSRSIEVNDRNNLYVSRPVVGEVAAGNPLLIYQDVVDSVDLPALANLPKNSFLLRVKGSSMKDAFILENDVIIVKPDGVYKQGELVVAIVDDSAVIKRIYEDDEYIRLVSENPEFTPIIVHRKSKNFRVIGSVLGLYRTLEAGRKRRLHRSS
ncbi:MAG: repressor LexA [Ignavibacteriaceae bacterium]|nr:repressor LexA [Ignavibacteriaceae bacterium]